MVMAVFLIIQVCRLRLRAGPVTFHLVRRPASMSSYPADTVQGVASLETDKFCPCLVELNPGHLN